jgi:Zn-dependent protease with chaperone function
MDFFEAQDTARRRTTLLVALFVLAVLVIVAVVYVAAHLALGPGPGAPAAIDVVLLLQVAFGVGLVIAIGTGIRTASLRRGGPAVAELLGGRRIPPDTAEPDERKLINVVEEMAIASGMPVPAVYVLDGEDGINAFAAGYSLHDSAVAVTRGALRSLTRDELQGVIAHEFSHILNGDMRLNIRLIGMLYGILLLAVIGRGIVYAGPRGGRRGGREGGAGWIILLGLALLLVGYVGVFFGKLIKAAISRQREFLADSAAVQFTRNPEGLAGVLKKIGAQAHGSRIQDHHAEELSHLFFANGLRSSLFGFLATHPPLEERIRRLDPSWDGDFTTPTRRPARVEAHAAAARRHGTPPRDPAGIAALAQLASPAALVASIGAPTPEHLGYAAALLNRFPDALTRAVHDPVESRALILALVAADSAGGATGGGATLGSAERAILREYGGEQLERRVEALVPLVRGQGPDARLPLLDLALPALLHLSPDEAESFRAAVERLIHADGRVRPFEYALTHTLARRLEAGGGRSRGGGRVRSFEPLRGDVEALLSAVAWAGSDGDADAARAAFEAGARRLPSSAGRMRLLEPSAVGLQRVDAALTALEEAAPALRRDFLAAAAECAAHDRRLQTAEVELLRAMAEALDCPMPPVLGVGGATETEVARG